MRGLKHPSTKTGTVRVLTTFLQIFGKEFPPSNKVHHNLLGFITPLLANAKSAEARDLLWLSGLQEPESLEDPDTVSKKAYTKIFKKLSIPDEKCASLLISMIVTVLQNAEYENEYLFLYNFLAEGTTKPLLFFWWLSGHPLINRPSPFFDKNN